MLLPSVWPSAPRPRAGRSAAADTRPQAGRAERLGRPAAYAVAGALVGLAIGFAVAMSGAADRLAARVAHHQDRFASIRAEIHGVLDRISHGGTEFCSDEELRWLRRIVFDTPSISDIGRLQDGFLHCTTVAGRLQRPAAVVEPDFVTAAGTSWWTDLDLLVSPRTRSTIAGRSDANVVLKRSVLADTDEPGMDLSFVAVAPDGRIVGRIQGPDPGLANVRAASASATIVDGDLRAISCSDGGSACVVGRMILSQALAAEKLTIVLFALAGLGMGVVVADARQRFRLNALSLHNKLRLAIARRELYLEYQPQVVAATGAVYGAEALVRWRDEDGSAVRPDIFVSLAEETGVITELTKFVVDRALLEFGPLLRAERQLRLSINVSSQDLCDPTFAAFMKRRLEGTGVRADQIALEITERETSDVPLVARSLQELRRIGVRVALDDFGTGYSNIQFIEKLPVGILKIDKTFSDSVLGDNVMRTATVSVLNMSNDLGLQVIAEGIDDPRQVDFFLRFKPDIILQGWHFSKALPIDAFRAWLESTRRSAGALWASPRLNFDPTGAD